MLKIISYEKVLTLDNVLSIRRIGEKELEPYGLKPYGLGLKKGDEVVLKDGECAYVDDNNIVRLSSSIIYLHALEPKEVQEPVKKKPTRAKKKE